MITDIDTITSQIKAYVNHLFAVLRFQLLAQENMYNNHETMRATVTTDHMKYVAA
jgi:hypothetical protein